jgi:hypothetical protein
MRSEFVFPELNQSDRSLNLAGDDEQPPVSDRIRLEIAHRFRMAGCAVIIRVVIRF